MPLPKVLDALPLLNAVFKETLHLCLRYLHQLDEFMVDLGSPLYLVKRPGPVAQLGELTIDQLRWGFSSGCMLIMLESLLDCPAHSASGTVALLFFVGEGSVDA